MGAKAKIEWPMPREGHGAAAHRGSKMVSERGRERGDLEEEREEEEEEEEEETLC